MKNHELNRQAVQIKHLIEATAISTNNDFELQGHWGKYLCVIVAGFLENAISEIYITFTLCSSSPPVASYTRKMLENISNPKSKKFVETATAFKKEWGLELDQYFQDNQNIKNAIDSIMTNRHLIAHGKTTNISIARVNEYYKSSIKAIEFIEKQCGNMQ